jgi:hypothetical protein
MHPTPGRRNGLAIVRPTNQRVHVGSVEHVGEAADPVDGEGWWVFESGEGMVVVRPGEVERVDLVR